MQRNLLVPISAWKIIHFQGFSFSGEICLCYQPTQWSIVLLTELLWDDSRKWCHWGKESKKQVFGAWKEAGGLWCAQVLGEPPHTAVGRAGRWETSLYLHFFVWLFVFLFRWICKKHLWSEPSAQKAERKAFITTLSE